MDQYDNRLQVTSFLSIENFAKYLLMHYEPGANVLLCVLRWLYKGPKPLEKHFVDVTKDKSSGLSSGEKSVLESLRDGEIALHQLDFSLMYSVTKLTCQVAPRNDPVWGRNCPEHRKQELEHHLYILKQGRNVLAHPSDAQKNLTNADVENKAEEMIKLLSSILTSAGNRAGRDPQEIQQLISATSDNIRRICADEEPHTTIQTVIPDLYEMIKEEFNERSKHLSEKFKQVAKDVQLLLPKSDADVDDRNEDKMSKYSGFKWSSESVAAYFKTYAAKEYKHAMKRMEPSVENLYDKNIVGDFVMQELEESAKALSKAAGKVSWLVKNYKQTQATPLTDISSPKEVDV